MNLESKQKLESLEIAKENTVENEISNFKPNLSKLNPSKLSILKEWSEMIKLEHTVFALPFALSGLVLASNASCPWQTWFWTILAFLGARSAAMTINRIVDAQIDSKNPRTLSRAIPRKKISKKQASIFAILSFLLMFTAASNLPKICLWLSPIAVFFLTFYSFTKRFTCLCHFILGICLGGASLGGWIAAGGSLLDPAPWWLALAVTTWVAGFDLIYALQDSEFDKGEKLFSIPALYGNEKALEISALLHIFCTVSLIMLGLSLNLSTIYWLGVIFVGLMLKYEHSLVKANDISRVNAAFFNTNGIVSIVTFIAITLDRFFAK